MEPHHFWTGGIWIFPIICIIFMMFFMFFMFFFFRNRRNGNSCWLPFFNYGKICEGYSESSIEILKKRYAKGEISKEEYESIKNDLLNE